MRADFYVIAREPGADNPAIPTWACQHDNPARLELDVGASVERRDLERIPGAFQLRGLLSQNECNRLIELSEDCGYQGDAAVSLGRDIRHNDSFTWVADDETCAIIWDRCAALVDQRRAAYGGKRALGLNGRFRFYRYRPGDYFSAHTDGSWPGTRIVGGELVDDAFGDRWSWMTFLLFLSDGYAGGATEFYATGANPAQSPTSQVKLYTPLGAALCFPHGVHPQHCLHGSETIRAGTKYIIRSDVLFEL